ncbi:hypothetical protein FK513_30540, partial [Klebsiella pneumoniae]|nr:hypothetical protein [Klebsiella pneumoniae]
GDAAGAAHAVDQQLLTVIFVMGCRKLRMSPEITFVGEQNDFMEVMGNVLDNACKYCSRQRRLSDEERKALLGIVADKWISAKWVYAICHLVGAL